MKDGPDKPCRSHLRNNRPRAFSARIPWQRQDRNSRTSSGLLVSGQLGVCQITGQPLMSKHSEPVIGRRTAVLALTGAGLVAAVPKSLVASAAAAPQRKTTSGKARYRADSAEVQTFYRVNRYPAK